MSDGSDGGSAAGLPAEEAPGAGRTGGGGDGWPVRVALPPHLKRLADIRGEVVVVPGEPTIGALLDALEALHPVLRGTIRPHGDDRRRPLIRFLACGLDLSHEPPDARLPPEVVSGAEVFHVVGSIAGGREG